MKERKANLNGRVVFTVILLLAIAAFILFAIFSPRSAEIDGDTLRFHHLFTRFEVPLSDIASVQLLEETPNMSKVSGIGVYFLSEGTYEAEGYGRCTASVNQSEPPFIAVTTSDGSAYIFSLNSQDATREFYGELASKTQQN